MKVVVNGFFIILVLALVGVPIWYFHVIEFVYNYFNQNIYILIGIIVYLALVFVSFIIGLYTNLGIASFKTDNDSEKELFLIPVDFKLNGGKDGKGKGYVTFYNPMKENKKVSYYVYTTSELFNEDDKNKSFYVELSKNRCIKVIKEVITVAQLGNNRVTHGASNVLGIFKAFIFSIIPLIFVLIDLKKNKKYI